MLYKEVRMNNNEYDQSGGVSGCDLGGVKETDQTKREIGSGCESDGVKGPDAGEGVEDDWVTSVLSACGLSLSDSDMDNVSLKKKKRKKKTKRSKGSENKLPFPAKVVGGRRYHPTTPVKKTGIWTARRREEVKTKWKDVMGSKASQKGPSDFTKREKMILLMVRNFNEEERERYIRRVKEDNYVRDVFKEVLSVPYEKTVQRTAEMTGISVGSVKRVSGQLNKLELTPKRKPGRTPFSLPDWVLTDIRLIIAGRFSILLSQFRLTSCIFKHH